jgi:hypothetical protein
MGYCTVDDVKSDFKGIEIEASGTSISISDCEEFIAQESAYINGRIATRYVTPVALDADTDAMRILKRICLFRVGERVKNILEIKGVSSQMDTDQKQNNNLARTPNDDLDLIVKGLLLLENASLKGTAQGVSSFNSDNRVGHTIDVTKQQW